MFSDIIITKRAYELDRLFCYRVPRELEGEVAPGRRVLVPFGKGKKEEGIVISVYNESPDIKEVKDVLEVLDDYPVITETGFKLAKFIKEKYITTYFDALRLNMPSGLKTYIEEKVYLKDFDCEISDKDESIIRDTLLRYNGCSVKDLKEKTKVKSIYKILSDMEEKGIVTLKSDLKNSIKEKKRTMVKYVSDSENVNIYKEKNKRRKTHIKALEFIEENRIVPMDLLKQVSGITKEGITILKNEGFLELFDEDVLRNPFANRSYNKDIEPELTVEQKKAVDEIINGKNREFLIHGVTGSGKTEVYMKVIEEMINCGKNAIVLVPEISLTPQMTERFIKRFKKGVAVLHSGLSKEERYDQMRLIRNGKINLVVGARSAIFAPVKNVGVIIVDEEHENSYKSDITPKYDTIEVAKERARIENAKLILASATPSVVSYYKAISGEYRLIELNNRINNMMPDVIVSDMRKELEDGNFSPVGSLLKEEIRKNIDNKEQTILFLNRRGYSTFVSCRSCGYVAKCPHCEVSLTYHKNGRLVCHYCGYEREMFPVCPDCGSKYIKYFGKGTEKVEEELKKEFPDAKILRMDADTTGKKFSHEKILKKFEEEKTDILLGTQMITKGLDFSNVTLSAVLAADGGLYLDDYRSLERTFSQITQVVGRAGRGEKKGRGIIQTYSPDHYVIELAKEGNYKKFYETEINLRKKMQFPPFCDIINIICRCEDKEYGKKLIKDTYNILVNYKNDLKLNDDDMRIYKPGFAPLSKIKNMYRLRVLMKVKNSENLKSVLEKVNVHYHKNYKTDKVMLSVDINPVNML